MREYQTLGSRQRLPGRAFTDPERTLADVAVMDRMLTRLRLKARSWADEPGPVELLEHPAAGLRHWLVVPRTCALRAAHQVSYLRRSSVGVRGSAINGWTACP